MKRLLRSLSLFTLLFAVASPTFSQCVVDYFSLQKKVYESDLVVEGKVINKRSYWDANKQNIYTLNLIKVYKGLNGITPVQEIELVTEGGVVGMERHQASPSLELELGEEGVFFLVNNTIPFDEMVMKNGYRKYQGTASIQSFVKYDRDANEAFGYHEKYMGIGSLLLPKIEEYSGFASIKVQNTDESGRIKPTAAPAITSFSVDTINAGTGALLTINGANFQIARGSGMVSFRDANFGDGRFYDVTLKTNYKSWSNSKIEVYVPARAGTGRVKVTNNSAESGISTDDIFIPYSHINALYGTGSVDTAWYPIDMVNDNTKGGYTWQMTNQFAANTNAVNAFMRALETWRCGTLMNWDVGQNTSTTANARDNINIVRFTKFGDSRLGVCWSRWNGCGSGNNLVWFLQELDIEFDSTRNWYYGDGTTPNSQFDFESVATHELGHGHQLGHVVDNSKIMHYSIGKGDRKTKLHADDIDAGDYVRDKSKVKNICGPSQLVPIKQEDCNITKPKPKFTANRTSACPETFFIFTDASEGIVNTYEWTFDEGASISSANTVGPWAVKYSTAGDKSVRLITGNDFGKDTFTMIVRVDSAAPDAAMEVTVDSITCVGMQTYMIDRPARAETYEWNLSGGGSIQGRNDSSVVSIDWTTAGGPYTLKVKAKNQCGESDWTEGETSVKELAKADFSTTENGLEVTFTNSSTSANMYAWTFGDGESSSDKDPFYTYPTRGKYTAQLIASNECSSDTMTKELDVTWGASVREINGPKYLVIGPNPIRNKATVSYNNASYSELQFVITDIQGKVIENVELKYSVKHTFERGDHASGVYLYELRSKGRTVEAGKLVFE